MLHDSETFRGSVRRGGYAAMMYCNDDRTPGESCFMSRMNAPWANPEQFGDALPEFLRSPMTLAMGASVLVHGIFFLGLPVVANHGDPQDIRPVNVVQLTPQDQAQVPAIAQQPLQPSSLIPNPLSPNGLLNPPVQVSPNPLSNSTPFDFSGLSGGGSTSQPSYSTPSYNTDDSYYQDRMRVAEAREAEARSALEKERLKVVTKPSPTPSPSVSPSPTPSVTPTALPSVAPSVASSATPAVIGSSPPPTNSPGSQATPTPASSQPPIVIASANPFNTAMAQKIPNGLVYNPENTQPVSALLQGTSSQWYSSKVLTNPRFQNQGNKVVIASPFAKQISAITLKSPRKAEEITSYDPKQLILIGFVMDPNGQILDDTIDVARSSGYPELNAIAVGEVRDRLRRTKFPPTATKKHEIYTIGVTFVP